MDILENAILYVKKGWYVFPCREKGGESYMDKNGKEKMTKEKSPYIAGGFKESTLDEKQIISWWKQYPKALIGISCGHSGLFVVDIDTKNGKDGMSNYLKLGIDTKDALHSITPSGGQHVVFKSNIGRSTTNVLQGIDTRGIGGYFIVPPSKLEDGRRYIATDDWNRDPPEISEELLKRINVAKHRKGYSTKIGGLEESNDETILQARVALERLPKYFHENYQNWIEIGMSLYDLGFDGLILWDNWSKKSSKYQLGICEEKWETFKPDEISLGSLFFWSREMEDI